MLFLLYITVKVKVKWSRYRPGVAQRVGRVIALLFHDRGTRRGWVVSSTPRPLFTPGKDPVPILQEAGWAPGPVWTGEKSRPHRDAIPDRPAHSQSLYRYTWPTRLHTLQGRKQGEQMKCARFWCNIVDGLQAGALKPIPVSDFITFWNCVSGIFEFILETRKVMGGGVSSVSIVSRPRAGRCRKQGSILTTRKGCLDSTAPWSNVGPIQLPIQWEGQDSFWDVKAAGKWSWPPPSNANAKNAWNRPSIKARWLTKHWYAFSFFTFTPRSAVWLLTADLLPCLVWILLLQQKTRSSKSGTATA